MHLGNSFIRITFASAGAAVFSVVTLTSDLPPDASKGHVEPISESSCVPVVDISGAGIAASSVMVTSGMISLGGSA